MMNQMTLNLPTSLVAKLAHLAKLNGVSVEEYAVFTLTERATLATHLQRVPDSERTSQLNKLNSAINELGLADDAAFSQWFEEAEEAVDDPEFTPSLQKKTADLLTD